MSFNRWLCFSIAAFVFLVSFPESPRAEEEILPIEGIVYDSKKPAESFAVIAGNIYKVGERYQDYAITEVRQDRILVKNSAGAVSEKRLTGGNHSAVSQPVADKLAIPDPLPTFARKEPDVQTTPAKPILDLLEQIKKWFKNFDLGALKNYASEISIIADLRNLHTRAQIFAVEEGQDQTLNLDALIKSEGVDPAYKKNKNGYRYRVEAAGSDGVRVYADPIQGKDKSKHFMTDENGQIHVELGSPASERSPLWNQSAELQGLTSQSPEEQGAFSESSEQSGEEENENRALT